MWICVEEHDGAHSPTNTLCKRSRSSSNCSSNGNNSSYSTILMKYLPYDEDRIE